MSTTFTRFWSAVASIGRGKKKTEEKNSMVLCQKEGNGVIHMGFCALGQTSPDEALLHP